MKRIIVKRLVYTHLSTGEVHLGSTEYNGDLTDENILGSIFHIGKHEWHPGMIGIYQLNSNGECAYRITVEKFYQYQKSWYNLFWDWIRRVV